MKLILKLVRPNILKSSVCLDIGWYSNIKRMEPARGKKQILIFYENQIRVKTEIIKSIGEKKKT